MVKLKYIKGYAKKYGVTVDGIIWSSKSGKWRKLKICTTKKGYQTVSLCRNGKMKTHLVHKLVMEAFRGPKTKGMEIRHFPDRNPANNKLSNLSYGTKSQNQRDRLFHGTDSNGIKSGTSKLTEKEVCEIRLLHESQNWTFAQLALKFGVVKSSIHRIINKLNWK